MKGVTLATFRRYHPTATKEDLRNISDGDLNYIYKKGYWDTVRAEELQLGVDLAVLDLSINSGPGRAARTLQKSVKAKQDGKVGPVTLALAAGLRGDDLVKVICASRMAFLRGLSHWSTFKNGWSRRVADIEARGVAMWLKANASVGGVTMALTDESHKAEIKARKTEKAAAGTTVGSVGGGGALEVQGFDTGVIIAGLAVVALAVIWMYIRSRHDNNRAEAYSKVAYEVRAAR
jgi:lysozyme family protein